MQSNDGSAAEREHAALGATSEAAAVAAGEAAASELYWWEAWEVERVEAVLAPLTVVLVFMSNATLLIHEARLVWRTRRLVQPKLLVLALCFSDLLATAIGFLPLWILFAVPLEFSATIVNPPQTAAASVSSTTGNELTNVSTRGTLKANNLSTISTLMTSVQTSSVTDTTASTLNSNEISTPHSGVFAVSFSLTPREVGSNSYQAAFFLHTAFWSLAQCIVVVMGVERFLALRVPFFYSARCSVLAFLAVLGLLLLLSCGVGVFLLLVHLQELGPEGQYYVCSLTTSNDSSSLSTIPRSRLGRLLTSPPSFSQPLMVYAGFLTNLSLAHNVFTLLQGVLWSCVLLLCNWAVRRELQRMEMRVTVVRLRDQSEYMKQLSMVHGAGREFARFMMAVNILFIIVCSPNLVSI
jgi:hypothetical protein